MRSSRDSLRRYPSLILLAGAIILAAFALPSSLILPQATPGQTLEYAPVPPNGQAPPGGSLSTLGLGTSGTLGSGGVGGVGLPAPPPGAGGNPSNKQCVGNPPRQTEDPLSPPCVAYFSGNNGGSTYQGVSGGEVRLVVYLWGGVTSCGWSDQCEVTPSGQTFDLGQAPSSQEGMQLRVLRAFQTYFNSRYQTYKRTVHFWVVYTGSSSADLTPAAQQTEAAQVYATYRPFAFITQPEMPGVDSFINQMAAHGVLYFSSASAQPAGWYQRYPGRIWSFLPSLDIGAQLFASYVCTKVIGHPVSFGGNDGSADVRLHNGQPRRLGLLYSTDQNRPAYGRFAALAQADIQACGGSSVFVDKAGMPYTGAVSDDQQSELQASQANMAKFLSEGISTIIWAQGAETSNSRAASADRYYPEWAHAWVVTPETRFIDVSQMTCYQALGESAPGMSGTDAGNACNGTDDFYDPLRQLFTGVQVAGPHLTPDSIDQGFHAIPPHESSDPMTPACFYDANDYTCVKDAEAEHWDAAGQAPNSQRPGCWREARSGARYINGRWPAGDVTSMQTAADPCNGFDPGATENAPGVG